jgi:hypothetical protein
MTVSDQRLRDAAADIRGWLIPDNKEADDDLWACVADLLEAVANEEWCCESCKYDPYNQNVVQQKAVALADAWVTRW